jgi:MoaA/NifB/PqqE/SkfB family radical SAM enzyme
MKKSYTQVIGSVLRKKPFFALKRVSTSFASVLRGSTPIIAYLLVSEDCPFTCDFCRRGERVARSKEEWQSLLEEMARAGVLVLGFSGGEPLLFEGFFDLVETASQLGFFYHVSSSGFGLETEGKARRLTKNGLLGVTLSVYDFDDDQRPLPYRKCLEVYRVLRSVLPSDCFVSTTTVLRKEDEDRGGFVVKRLLSMGVGNVGVMPCHDDKGKPMIGKGIGEVAKSLVQMKMAGASIDNSYGYLDALTRLKSEEAMPVMCLVPRLSVTIGPDGTMFACIPDYLRSFGLGNVFEKGFLHVWLGDEAKKRRRELSNCRACLWNCHTETNLLFAPWVEAKARLKLSC